MVRRNTTYQDAPMAKRKDRTRVVAQMRLPSSRKPYYFTVVLWEDIADLHAYFDEPADSTTLAMTCFEPWFVDDDTGNVYINPKLGEIHFARNHWNANVVAHEVFHAIVHRMRLIWPPAHLILLDEYAEAEEEVAYELGNWTERVHNWLWDLDPPGDDHPIPYDRGSFGQLKYLSPVRYPKSGLRIIKRGKPNEST